ncbi:hypothetical protein ACJIZ3_003186 [Penstemon smallii]|uniref:Uncharacterized protein n=1 Tax=Penstemon smallii TaxID=265156 RepID=A0ABD3TEK4_9LAMI
MPNRFIRSRQTFLVLHKHPFFSSRGEAKSF